MHHFECLGLNQFCGKNKHSSQMFWIKPKQITHWEGEAIVWHITTKMRDKYLICYKMSFDEFNNLVEELIPFLKSKCINWMRPQLEINKIVAVVLICLFMGLILNICQIHLMWAHLLYTNMWISFMMAFATTSFLVSALALHRKITCCAS